MGKSCGFDTFDASLGVASLANECDGDCGLDAMLMMLGRPSSFSTRKELRIEISDYQIERIGESWMQDLMALCQELRQQDLSDGRSGDTNILAVPIAPAPAAAEPAYQFADPKNDVSPDAETFATMRWASKLDGDSNACCLFHSLRCLDTKAQRS